MPLLSRMVSHRVSSHLTFVCGVLQCTQQLNDSRYTITQFYNIRYSYYVHIILYNTIQAISMWRDWWDGWFRDECAIEFVYSELARDATLYVICPIDPRIYHFKQDIYHDIEWDFHFPICVCVVPRGMRMGGVFTGNF